MKNRICGGTIKSVVCMTVGDSLHVIIDQKMLKSRDGGKKDEGVAGGKRLTINDLLGVQNMLL